MDNGLWDALHRLTLKVDRLVMNAHGTEEISVDGQILKTWTTFYELFMGKRDRVWTLACSKVDTIGEYHDVQDHARITNHHIGYSKKTKDGYTDETTKHLPCVWFHAYVDVRDTDNIVLDLRIRNEVLYGHTYVEEFSDKKTVSGTPKKMFDWLNENLTLTGYKN